MIARVDKRIAITGTGICTSIGSSPSEVAHNLIEGRSGIDHFDGDGQEQMISRFAAVHKQFKLDSRVNPRFASWWIEPHRWPRLLSWMQSTWLDCWTRISIVIVSVWRLESVARDSFLPIVKSI